MGGGLTCKRLYLLVSHRPMKSMGSQSGSYFVVGGGQINDSGDVGVPVIFGGNLSTAHPLLH